MGFSFGDFNQICSSAALVVCPLMSSTSGVGIQPNCYARNVELSGIVLFQPAVLFIHIIALVMLAIMILHIKSKYTAVGRKEIVHFFYLYGLVTFLSFFLDGGIVPSSSSAYPWFAAIQTGILCATFWCLLFAEDGTPLSLWASFSPSRPIALWIMLYIFNGACLIIYVILQLILVVRTLDDRWPIGDILFGLGFFTVGLVLVYGFSLTICDAITHYVDGPYWDSITKEDLEFSVGSKQAVWDISTKEGLLAADDADYFANGTNGNLSPVQSQAFQVNSGRYPPQGAPTGKFIGY
ncbi:chitin synthase III catalytic subunit [Phakopsora pachyrhizi]|nr:chitin synthase III catalytic subunit [Phakopsora pachyrhizi]